MKLSGISGVWGCVAVVASLLLLTKPHVAAQEAPPDKIWSSSREIRHLSIGADGSVWAESNTSILCYQQGVWNKFSGPIPPHPNWNTTSTKWRGLQVNASLDGLVIRQGPSTKTIPLPKTKGTHITALFARPAAHGEVLWSAIFGDGLWQWDGQVWSRVPLQLPTAANEVTALAQSRDGKTIWVGTRRQGAWQYSGGCWKQHLQSDEPFANNIQCLQSFQGKLWASTLEDGLLIHDAQGWRHLDNGTISSNAPRQMVVFQNCLYVRHSNEAVDCFDGRAWQKHVFPNLPRKQILSIAADAKRLYLGQWGGWSEWDGKNFTHHLKHPELQIVPLMQMFSDKGRLWLGTENRGLFEWESLRGTLRNYDERNGLPDDWITALNRNGNTLLAGTFMGGLAWCDNLQEHWQSASSLQKRGITAIVTAGPQWTWVATRFGLYLRDAKGQLHLWDIDVAPDEREVQALLLTSEGLWVATRSSIIFCSRETLTAAEASVTQSS